MLFASFSLDSGLGKGAGESAFPGFVPQQISGVPTSPTIHLILLKKHSACFTKY